MMFTLHKKHLLLDIETSGLHPKHHHLVCIGVTFLNNQQEPEHKQWILQKEEEEQALLLSFLDFCRNYERIYTYNGKRFDWPFLMERLAYHQLPPTALHHLQMIDMKKPLSYFYSTREVLEKKLLFTRVSSTSGKALVQVYTAYKTSGEDLYKQILLMHNQGELNALKLYYEVYMTLYELTRSHVKEAINTEDSQILCLELPYELTTSYTAQYEDFELTWTKYTSYVQLKTNYHWKYLKQPLTPYKDYYYVPSQNELIHHTLAAFMPKESRRKATKEECYIEQEGWYMSLYTRFRVSEIPWEDHNKHYFLPTHQVSPELILNQFFYLCFNQTVSYTKKTADKL